MRIIKDQSLGNEDTPAHYICKMVILMGMSNGVVRREG